MADFAQQVEALRPQLLRYARSQLRNDAWAEDAVSDTLLAALEKPQGFGGASALKTWLDDPAHQPIDIWPARAPTRPAWGR